MNKEQERWVKLSSIVILLVLAGWACDKGGGDKAGNLQGKTIVINEGEEIEGIDENGNPCPITGEAKVVNHEDFNHGSQGVQQRSEVSSEDGSCRKVVDDNEFIPGATATVDVFQACIDEQEKLALGGEDFNFEICHDENGQPIVRATATP